MELRDYCRVPLVDLGEHRGQEYRGIYMPKSELDRPRIGVTAQFLEGSQAYHDRYTEHEYWASLINDALAHLAVQPGAGVVLDVGSGSGNTVIPMLSACPETRIVATDISPNLLRILRDLLAERELGSRCALVCTDIQNQIYREQCFDLAVGGAILHHVVDPGQAVATVLAALKPGAHAIFFEPFEVGNGIMALAYTEILAEAERRQELRESPLRSRLTRLVARFRRHTATPTALQVLRQALNEHEARISPRHAKDLLALDDKWLFTRSYLEQVAEQSGAAEVIMYPIHQSENQFSRHAAVSIYLSLRAGTEALPEWAWKILKRYDQAFSATLLKELLIEGCVIFRKEG